MSDVLIFFNNVEFPFPSFFFLKTRTTQIWESLWSTGQRCHLASDCVGVGSGSDCSCHPVVQEFTLAFVSWRTQLVTWFQLRIALSLGLECFVMSADTFLRFVCFIFLFKCQSVGTTYLRGLNNSSLIQGCLSPSPVFQTNTMMMVNQNEIRFSKFLFVLFSEGDLLEQSVGSGTFVVAVERTW